MKENLFEHPCFFFLGYLLEPRIEILEIFLKFGRIMANKNLRKALDFSNLNFVIYPEKVSESKNLRFWLFENIFRIKEPLVPSVLKGTSKNRRFS